ncbi:uncharacterized protein LOC116342074 [Contarinia nasturtii]|uniref:uncharacterized protein LOC116342074 n=1 Tax=Contarinia nasturtii TaxID=265458 RepID=UPI0012D3960A|nr:uncharacterized protein LOC116342074 [Contarinia nasturtii]
MKFLIQALFLVVIFTCDIQSAKVFESLCTDHSQVSFAYERVKTILNHLSKDNQVVKDVLASVEAEWGPVVDNIAAFSERCHTCAQLYDKDVQKYQKKASADKKIAPIFKKAVNEYLSDFRDMTTQLDVYTTPMINNFLAPIINEDDASEIFKYLQDKLSDLMEIFQHVHNQSDVLIEHTRCEHSSKFDSDLQYVLKNKKLRPKTPCTH